MYTLTYARTDSFCWSSLAVHCCSASRDRHTEVRPRSDTAPSRWAALALCGRSGHVQARLDGIQMSSRPSARLLYLSELCMPVAQVAERQHLRSASRNLLVAPRFQLDTYGRRAFAVAAPATWNSLSDELRNPDLHSATFQHNIKTFLVNSNRTEAINRQFCRCFTDWSVFGRFVVALTWKLIPTASYYIASFNECKN